MNAAAGLLAAKFALGPLLLPQSRWLKRNALRLPEAAGPREGGVGAGGPLLRLLVVGDSSAAGVGVADQAQALALPLARCLANGLGRRSHGNWWRNPGSTPPRRGHWCGEPGCSPPTSWSRRSA